MNNIKKTLKIRPYARLLTMLGEQLIKNERIALIELIKNSYDADADWVKVSFLNFGNEFEVDPKSSIVIEDCGCGMDVNTIEKHWLNPATPSKKIRKQYEDKTPKGRVIQGEKGIGRFAILKLGRKIQIISRAEDQDIENIIEYDFSKYDDEFLTCNGNNEELFIDDLDVTFQQRKPEVIIQKQITLGSNKFIRPAKGTKIIISNLKGTWSTKKVESISYDLNRFQSIFPSMSDSMINDKQDDKFKVFLYKNNDVQHYQEQYIEKLNFLMNDRAVFKIENGYYDENRGEFKFLINGIEKVLKLKGTEIAGLGIFKENFGRQRVLDTRKTECGSFHFGFYIFDFTHQAPAKYLLDSVDKGIIKNHRIYLYRDGIRVYPYGDPSDDWLHIDIDRGTKSAGDFLSNNQVVGYVSISQKENPHLQDKTNREGLIDEGNATDDFLTLLRIFLNYIRKKPYARYRLDLENKNVQDVFHIEQIQMDIDELKVAAKDNHSFQNMINKLEKEYKTERKYLVQRAETTEDLAGVGLSVETASHDIVAVMSKATSILDDIIRDTLYGDSVDINEINKELQSLRGSLSFIEAQLKDIQLLFKSTKQRRRLIRVKEVLEKIERIYKRTLKKEDIKLKLTEVGSPLVAKTTDAVLLQLFLNLFDNSIYWIHTAQKTERRIEITLDGSKEQLIFSDNGPGILKEDEPYIFQPFYSGKGEEGKGLGLYIAKQLLERNEYSIYLAELRSEKILSGANFVISFVSEDK